VPQNRWSRPEPVEIDKLAAAAEGCDALAATGQIRSELMS
jgi:hypothetical protein